MMSGRNEYLLMILFTIVYCWHEFLFYKISIVHFPILKINLVVFLQLLFDDSGDFTFSIFGLAFSTYNILVEGIFSTLGQIFIASLKMLVVPLVFVSLICGTSTLSDPRK